MKITKIRIVNCGSIDDLTIPMSSVVSVSGKNAEGKTSIIKAIVACFDGGHQPDLIGKHGEQATIEVDLDTGHKIKRIIKPKKSDYQITGDIMDSPAAWVKSLVSGLTLNPSALTTASPKERKEFIDKVMPVTFSKEEIEQSCGGTVFQISDNLTMEQFDRFAKGRYDTRTDVNRDLKSLQSTKTTLTPTVKDGDDIDWSKKEQSLSNSLTAARQELAEVKADAEREITAEIRKVDKKLQDDIDALKVAALAEKDRIHKLGAQQLEELVKPISKRIEDIVSEHATARANADAQVRNRAALDTLKQMDQQISEKTKESNRLDKQIAALAKLRQDKLANLSVPGVEMRDGQLFYNGMNFDTQLNKAQQVLVGFQLAAESVSGGLPFFILDNAESLDDFNEADLVAACKESGFQVILAKVARQGELQVQAV